MVLDSYFDLNLWKNLQDNFSGMLDLHLILINKDGTEVLSSNASLYYQLIYNDSEGRKRIIEERRNYLDLLGKGEIKFFESFNYLANIILPIYIGNEKVGGIVALVLYRLLDVENCKKVSNKVNLSYIDLMNLVYQLKVRDKGTIEIYGKILHTLVGFIPEILKEKKEKEIQISKLEILNLIGVVINSTLDLSEVLKLIRYYMIKITNAKECTIVLDDEKLYFNSENKKVLSSVEIRIERKLYDLVKNNGSIVVIDNINEDYRFERTIDEFKSRISVPIKAKEKFLGALNLAGEKLSINDKDFDFLQIIASQISMAIENARLYYEIRIKAITDGLTGLYNRRYFNELLEKECKRSNRYNLYLSLIIFDIDHFKQYNDTFGHLEGDKVIIDISNIVKNIIRKDVDYACRYGGEEFVILLPETNLKGAIAVAERIRKNIEILYNPSKGDLSKVTSSFGVAEYFKNEELDKFVNRADDLLYASKQNGRNRIYPLLEGKE